MTRLLSFALLLVLLAAVPAAAQPPRAEEERKQPTVAPDGTDVFLYLLDRAKLKPVKADELGNTPVDSSLVVIALGDPTSSRRGGRAPLFYAAQAIRSGGGALIAADSQVWFLNHEFPNARGVNGDTMIASATVRGGDRTRREDLFMGNQFCPFVVPFDRPPNRIGAEWDLFDGLNRIATNRPSYIVAPNPRAEFGSVLAAYPDGCRVETGDLDPEKHFFAVGGSGRHPNFGTNYRFLALADPSVFINQMMLASDANGPADNLEFGARVVEYLREDDNGRRRTRCLVFQNGEVVDDFSKLRGMMQPPLPLPNVMAMQDKITDFGNKILDHFQTNDTSNKMLLGTEEEKRNRNFLGYVKYVFFALIMIRIVWYLLRQTWTAKRPADGPPPPSGGLPPAPKKKEKPRGLFDRRQKELLRRNNLYEPVRMVVRDMFLAAGGPEEPGKRLPEVEISDVVGRPDTLVDALTDLWKIAYGPARVVTVQRWKLLEPLFERVRSAHAEGKWRFV